MKLNIPIEVFNVLDRKSKIERVYLLYGMHVDGLYSVSEAFEAPNRHKYPSHNFQVLKSDLSDIHNRPGTELVGVLHAHPTRPEQPTYEDVLGIPDDMIGVVYFPNSKPKKIVYYNKTDGYVGEEFL